ncbi:MAG: HlyD family efflux transporter periplasmic adaptor subunit [Pseudoflavonifractor sp.]|nr:HlyD family efflux transporter periplasmic adaptor subunit [Pseudoflavonifractor sp.]
MNLWKKKTAGETNPAAPVPKKKRKLTRKRVISFVVVAALLCGAGFGVKVLFFSEEEAVALTGFTTYGSLSTSIEGTGTTLPADSYTVTAASTSAKITGIYVSAGDTVEVGDLLYTQDDSALDDEIDECQSEIDSLNDQIDDYNDQLSDLQDTLSELTITAPFVGRVVDLNAEVGDEVQKGTKLLTLVDDSKMTLTEYFSYAYEGQIYEGMSAGVSISSLMNTFDGTVTKIEKVDRLTTEGTRCFAVTITVTNPGALTEGMTGAAWVTSDTGEKIYPAVEGGLEYYNSKTLTTGAAGDLLAVNVVDYQKVSAGQTLISIDGSDYRDQISSIEKKITQAQERITTYKERMADTEESRGDYNVTSDIAGKVIMVNVRVGETPRSGMTAVAVYNLNNMEISANIDELDIDSIEMGMEVKIVKSGSGGDNETYTGTVTEISYEATNSDGVAYFPVTITIPANGKLSAGVNVSYYISVGDAEEGVLAPLSALKDTTEGTCLFVKADSKPDGAVDLEGGVVPDGFYAVPVEVGSTNSQYARILSGVEEGAEVFTRYQQSAPSNGDTTSTGDEEKDTNQQSNQGGMPGGGMPGGGGGGFGGPMG